VPEGLLHLVFSSSGLASLWPRIGDADCVVLMSQDIDAITHLPWPCGVRVCVLAPGDGFFCGAELIGYRELVALTSDRSLIVSW
jgi:hypothetical protein